MKKVYKDHLGNIYRTKKEMLAFYGIPESAFRYRTERGNLSLEQALTMPLKERGEGTRKPVTDHTGRDFVSVEEMCKYWGIPRGSYEKKIRRKVPLEKILTAPVREFHEPIKCKDHLGNEFDSKKEMLRHYGIPDTTFTHRMERKWSLERALTERSGFPGENMQIKCKDHLGNEYSSISEMCRAYGANRFKFFNRLEAGWSIKDALTRHDDGRKEQSVDHLGNVFESKADMCRYYKTPVSQFAGRIKAGWTVEEALTIPRKMYIGEYRVAKALRKLNVKYYHDCSIKKIFHDFDINIDWDDFLTRLQTSFKKAGLNWTKQKIQRLRPDFVLYKDDANRICGVIEFDGEQHQNYLDIFFKTIRDFLIRNDYDVVKQSLWEYLNIPMLRIRHDQLGMIDDMVKHFVEYPEYYIKNHNTYLSEDEYWKIFDESKKALCA